MSQAGPAAVVSATEVRNAVAGLVDRGKSMLANLGNVTGSVMTATEYLALLDDKEKVSEYRELVARLGKLAHEVKANQQVLARFSESYQPSLEETDFKAALSNALKQELERKPYDPRSDPLMKDFNEALGGADGVDGSGGMGGGEEEEELDDEEDVRIGGGQQRWINTTCPISLKNVMELEDPVKDSLGYVYEKASVLQYLRGHTNGYKHPVAGVQQNLHLGELVPAAEVQREKRRQQLRDAWTGGAGGGGEGGGAAGGTKRGRAPPPDEIIDV